MKLSRDIRSSDGKLYRYYARKSITGQWYVSCDVYGRDGYYIAFLGCKNVPASERDIDNIFDR